MIGTVSSLHERGHKVNCLIVGDGPEKSGLMKLRDDLHLQNYIDFKDYAKPVKNLLDMAKIYLLTSESEGLPMSMIEAMSCGLPVVVPHINDIPDVVKHGYNGYLIPPAKVDKYWHYCSDLLMNEGLRIEMGYHARKTIERLYASDYSYDMVYQKWNSILSKLASRK